MNLTEALRTINKIENAEQAGPRFNENRFPYTYAYDYMRGHWEEFGIAAGSSRADCSVFFKGNPEKTWICYYLASAYLRQEHIEKPADFHWEPSEEDLDTLERLLKLKP